MTFIEATSDLKGRDFRHPDMREGYHFGFNGDELGLSDGDNTWEAPVFILKDFTREDYVFVETEAIEVGDEIHVKNHPAPEVMSNLICDVTQIKDRIVSFEARITYFADIDDCVFVEKGPKVHTFEGVKVEYVERWTGTMIEVPYDTKLIDNGKTYTITLKEVSDG